MPIPNHERDIDAAGRGMSSFEFLKRCSRPACERIRSQLEEWFGRYPEVESDELKSRFRSEDEAQFLAAFWELYLHECLCQFGYTVEVHPELDTEGDERPDFLAQHPEEEDILVEAASTQMRTEEPSGPSQQKDEVIDAINELSHPDFRLQMKTSGRRSWPEEPPSRNRVQAELRQWLDTLDYEPLRTALEERSREAMPEKEFDLRGWEVTFVAVPKPQDQRDSEDDRIIGVEQLGVQWVDSSTPIRKRVREKATRYGDVERPYVVAVNIADPTIDEIDIFDALFGDETLLVSMVDPAEGGEMKRVPNGAWRGPGGPRNTRVSAVLLGLNVEPWRVATAPLLLCHNPWAERRVGTPHTALPEYDSIEGEYRKGEGVHPQSVFDLPDQWPTASE